MATVAELQQQLERLVTINDLLGDLVESVGQTAALDSQDRHVYGDPHYSYVPFDHGLFLDAMIGIKIWLEKEGWFSSTAPDNAANFLDVGCGIADKVVLARQLGFNSYGVEYDSHLLHFAKLLFCHNGKLSLSQQCALEFDYSGYHVIYFYQPFQDDEMQAKLERRIYRQVDLATFIVTPQCVNAPSQRQFIRCAGYGSEATEDSIAVFRRVRKGKDRFVSRI